MKKFLRRGQAAIEFALILPIFAMVLFALVYLGFLFIDVVTLDSAAAAAARSAAQQDIKETVNDVIVFNEDKIKVSDAVKKKIQEDTKLFLYWYEMDADSPKRTKLDRLMTDDDPPEIEGYFIEYGVQVKLKDSVKDNAVLKMFLPEKYTVVKTAYKKKE